MNYYVQGDEANADKIKAEFNAKGIDVTGWEFSNPYDLYFSVGNKIHTIEYSIKHIVTGRHDYTFLKLPVQPKFKFKVGDWIVQNDNGTVSQITKVINAIDEDGEYRAYEHTNGYFHEVFENEYHLWSIADAKDGDILSAKIDGDDYILIFKQIKDGWIETYGHYYITIDKFCAPTQMFCRNYQGRLYPATQEQYRTLFKKMHDDWYEWDFDKKELKKIQPHYDIANFYAGMEVLVRDDNDEEWNYLHFSHYRKKLSEHFFAGGNPWFQCIPFNDDTKHLLGTTDMCDEMYINW